MEQRGVVAAETISVLLMSPFLIVLCLRQRAPTPLWKPGSIPNNWADVCGFLKPPGSQSFWRVNKHGAFSIPQALGSRPNDQSCHHETGLHLDFVDWSNKWSNQAYYSGNIRLVSMSKKMSYEVNDIVANSRKNPLEACAETAEAIRSDDRRKETKLSAHDHFSWSVLSS